MYICTECKIIYFMGTMGFLVPNLASVINPLTDIKTKFANVTIFPLLGTKLENDFN